MAKLNRRRNGSHALENRQMFAADIVQSVFVPLADEGINAFNEVIYDDLYDPRYDPTQPEYNPNLGSYTPNLSGTVTSVVTVAIHEDNTYLYIDHHEDAYDDLIAAWTPGATTSELGVYMAGDVVTLPTSSNGYNLDAGDRISASGQITLTRQVHDSGFSITYPRDLESGVVNANDRLFSGTDFSVTFLNNTYSGTIDTTLFTDRVGFISSNAEGTDIIIETLAGDPVNFVSAASPLGYGEQIYISDQALIDRPGGLFPNGWASVSRIYTTSATGEFSLSFAAGNDALNTSYWFEALPTEKLGTEYLLPMPNNFSSSVGSAQTRDVVYLVHNPGASDANISLTYRDNTGAAVSDPVISIAAGTTQLFSDIRSAASLSSDVELSVTAVLAGVDIQYSGWATSVLPADFLGSQVTLADPSVDVFWIAPTADTSVLISGLSSGSVSKYLNIYEYNGVSVSGTLVTNDQLERVESSSGDVWYRFEAQANAAYRIQNISGDSITVSTDGAAKVAVVNAPANSYDYGAYASLSPSVPKFDMYRDLRELTFADGKVGLGETGQVALTIENNSATSYVISATGELVITDNFDFAPAADLYSEVGGVTINLYDADANLYTATATIADLRVGGIDLYDAFFAAGYTMPLVFETGGRLEVLFDIQTPSNVRAPLIDADYALVGTTVLEFMSQPLVQIRSPLSIEVSDAPEIDVLGSVSERGLVTIAPYRDTSGEEVRKITFTQPENVAHSNITIKLDLDLSELMTADPGNTKLVIGSQTLFDVSTYAATNGLNTGFSLVGNYGTLAFVSSARAAGEIVLSYTKAADYYDHSTPGAVLYDLFDVVLTNDQYKYSNQQFEFRIVDINPTVATASLLGGDFVESSTATLSGNILTSTGAAATEPDIGSRVVSVVSGRYRVTDSGSYSGYYYTNGGEITINGRYGDLTLNSDGSYDYALRIGTSQLEGISLGEINEERFLLEIGDYDWSLTNRYSLASASLTFSITGEQDIFVVTDLTPFAVPIPENGTVTNHEIVFQSPAGIRQIGIDLDGITDGAGNYYLFDQTELSDFINTPVELDTGEGILTLERFDFVANESGTLTFSYAPIAGAISSAVTDKIGFFIVDNRYETLPYDLSLNLIPPISTSGLNISIVDTNGVDTGSHTVIEDGADRAITVTVERSDNWKSISVGGQVVADYFGFSDYLNTTITGSFGELTFTGANLAVNQLYFIYAPNPGALDHSLSDLTDSFSITAEDLNSVTTNRDLVVLIADTAPSAAGDSQGDATLGALTEDLDVAVGGNAITSNDTDSVDSGLTVVGVSAGANLTTLNSDPALLQSFADGGVGILGSYGRLWITPEGDYEYRLDNTLLATQRLKTGDVVTDVFSYTIADADASEANNTDSFSSANIVIFINGEDDQDPIVSTGELNTTLPVPENGSLTNQRLVLATNADLDTVSINGTTYTAAQLASASTSTPINVVGAYGTMTITGYDSATGALTYSYQPSGSGFSGESALEGIDFVVSDIYGESSAFSLSLEVIPPISEEGPTITVVDDNGAVTGDYTVNENESISGIVVKVEPVEFWNTIAVDGTYIVYNADPSSFIGTVITGDHGRLRFDGADVALGELYFSYTTTPDLTHDADGDSLNHKNGLLLDSFEIQANDLLNLSASEELEILVADTTPNAYWDELGSEFRGVLTEDSDQIIVTGNVIDNDEQSLDSPNRVVGVRAGGFLFEFTSPVASLLPRSQGGVGVSGEYGTLWLSQDGSFEYELDNSRLKTQQLLGDSPAIADVFTYVLADADASSANGFTGYDSARILIYINGADDPKPIIEISDTNSTIPVPENGRVEDQSIALTVNVPLASISVGDLNIPRVQLLALSPDLPIVVPLDTGTFTIKSYNVDTGILVYDYAPTENSVVVSGQQNIVPIKVVDIYGEQTELGLTFDVVPARVSEIPPVTRTEALAPDGTATLVRPVYQQQIGTPQVLPAQIELTDPASYFGGEFELGPIVDDRRFIETEPFIPEEYALLVQRDIPPQLLSVESRVINYVVPSDTFLHTDQQARVNLSVTLIDGSPIPDWLEFDPNTATFSGIAPPDVVGEFQILIIARDDEGRQAETIMRLIVESPSDEVVIGRQGFSDQLADEAAEGNVDAG